MADAACVSLARLNPYPLFFRLTGIHFRRKFLDLVPTHPPYTGIGDNHDRYRMRKRLHDMIFSGRIGENLRYRIDVVPVGRAQQCRIE